MNVRLILGCVTLISSVTSLLALDVAELNKRSNKGFSNSVVKDWKAPDERTIPQNLFGDTVRYGKALVHETYK